MEKINSEIQYNFKNLVDKKIYLEDKGYEFDFQLELSEDEPVDLSIDGCYEVQELFRYYKLLFVITEKVFYKAYQKYQEKNIIYNEDILGRKSNLYKQFKFSREQFFFQRDDIFYIDIDENEVIINYIEKCYEVEKLKEKLPIKGTKEGLKKI